MGKKISKTQADRTININCQLTPGTEEYRAYSRVKRKYIAELAKRQADADDEDPCEIEFFNSEFGRAAVIYFSRVNQEELPEILASVRRKKGRPEQESKEAADSIQAPVAPAETLKKTIGVSQIDIKIPRKA